MEKSVQQPSRIWTAPAALLNACRAASASAFARLGVAAAAAVQNGKSAVADYRAARALAKAQTEATKLSRAQAVERAGGSRPAQNRDGTTLAVPTSNTVLLPTLPEFDFVAELVAADPVPQAEAVAIAETFAEPESAPQEFRPDVAEIVPAPTALRLVSIVETSEIVVEEPVSAGGLDLPSAQQPFKADLDEAIDHATAAFVIADAADAYVDEAVFDRVAEPPSTVQAIQAELDAGKDLAPVADAEEIASDAPKAFEPIIAAQSFEAHHNGRIDGFSIANLDNVGTVAEAVLHRAAFEQPSAMQPFEAEPDAGRDPGPVAVADAIVETRRDEPAISRDADVLTPEAPGTWTAPALAFPASIVAFPTRLAPPEDFTDEPSTQYELFALEGAAGSVAHVNTTDDWIWGRAYFLACAVAFPVAVGLMCKFGGPAEFMTGLGPVAQVVVAAVSPLVGLVFFLPAVGLVHLARLVGIPRGFRDVLTGGLLGSSWLLLALHDGLTPPVAAYCLLAGGLLGGMIFWLANRPTWRRTAA